MKFFHLLGIALILGSSVSYGQDSGALIDALVRKKILTAQEAEDIRADLIKENNSSADKIKLSSSIKELSLYGDVRLRYQYSNLDPQFDATAPHGDPGHGKQGSKFNYRLRLNADFKLTDNWFGGVQLTTGSNADTGSQTYENGFSNNAIFISRAYVGWKNDADWLTVVGGKQPNPFYTTDLMWDPNINPSGAVEVVKFHKLFGGDIRQTTCTDGGKTVTSLTQATASPWELTFAAGQFAFCDNDEFAVDGQNSDAFLFEEQLIFGYRFSKDVKLTVAPAYLAYTAAQIKSAVNTQPFTGIGGTRDLSIIQVPGDLSFKVGGLCTKFLWDFAYNTDGGARTREVYGVDHSSQDNIAFQVGFQLGQNVKKGDWSLLTTYRQVGIAAVDPNLNASDWGLSRVNLRGWKLSAAYNFTNAVIGQITFFAADNLRGNLVGGQATGGSQIADANSDQLLTIDLNVKF